MNDGNKYRDRRILGFAISRVLKKTGIGAKIAGMGVVGVVAVTAAEIYFDIPIVDFGSEPAPIIGETPEVIPIQKPGGQSQPPAPPSNETTTPAHVGEPGPNQVVIAPATSSPPAPTPSVLDSFGLRCTDENDLVISGEIPEELDVWSVGTWGTEQGAGDPETSILAVGEDSQEFEYTWFNYISSKPKFYYDLTIEAFDEQAEGEKVLLDKGTDREREASRGELFYPGDHGIEPVASRTISHVCDMEK